MWFFFFKRINAIDIRSKTVNLNARYPYSFSIHLLKGKKFNRIYRSAPVMTMISFVLMGFVIMSLFPCISTIRHFDRKMLLFLEKIELFLKKGRDNCDKPLSCLFSMHLILLSFVFFFRKRISDKNCLLTIEQNEIQEDRNNFAKSPKCETRNSLKIERETKGSIQLF